MDKSYSNISVIMPAKNEGRGLSGLLSELVNLYSDAEIIVVNDGSTDDTKDICDSFGVKVINQPYSMGNGASIKAGARFASRDIIIFMDADGQHDPHDIPKLVSKLNEGYDMVVGARSVKSQANIGRLCANTFYNWFASKITGHNIPDLTSGFRAVKAGKFREFIHLLPNGFSYPTTITMAFFRSGYSVAYISIEANKRIGKSHIRIMRDGIRFLIIMFKVGTLYSPLKIFIPFSAASFALGIGHYIYTYISHGRFTNMSALLLLSSVLIFLIGLVSEQIAMLLYKNNDNK